MSEDLLKTTPRGFLLALQKVEWELLPANLGSYPVTLNVDYDYSTEDSDSLSGYTFPIAGTITLSKGTLPPGLEDIPLLTKLPLVLVSVEATGSLCIEITNPKGELENVHPNVPDESLLYVRPKDLLPLIWKEYGVNVASLKAMLAAIEFEAFGRSIQWEELKRILGKKAFGHAPEVFREIFDTPVFMEQSWLRELPEFAPPDTELEYLQAASVPSYTSPTVEDIREIVSENRTLKGCPFPCPVSSYLPLSATYYLLAFLDLAKAKELTLPLPSNDCAILFSEDNKAEVFMLETWGPPATSGLPLEPRKEYGKTADQIDKLFRYRHELGVSRESRRKMQEELFHHSYGHTKGDSAVKVLTDADKLKREQLRKEINNSHDNDRILQDKILDIYSELTAWASKHKERILKAQRDKEKVSLQIVEAKAALKGREFVALPNNMDKLPAHFAAIPSGLESGLHMATDQFGRAILRVRRQGLEIAGNSQPPQEQIPFTLPMGDLQGAEQSIVMEQAKKLFGENGPRWLMPQGIVAVSKLYSDLGGYSGAESVVRLHLNDWIDTMRPHQVKRFAEKGRGEAFGKDHRPKDLFHALLGILHRLTYDSQVMPNNAEWSNLSGFYLITASGEDARGPWTEVMLNPSLHKFITGDGGLPYMITNTQAMFGYDRGSLDYTPAAQMGLEQLARNIMMKTDTATLATGKGDGITRLALAQRFGILRGPNEKNAKVLERFNRVLDNLGTAGVLAGWKADGKDKTGADAFGVKLHLTMHEDYRKAYNLTRMQTLDKELDKQLAAPFAVPKPNKGYTYQEPPKKKRGRPPKQKG